MGVGGALKFCCPRPWLYASQRRRHSHALLSAVQRRRYSHALPSTVQRRRLPQNELSERIDRLNVAVTFSSCVRRCRTYCIHRRHNLTLSREADHYSQVHIEHASTPDSSTLSTHTHQAPPTE